MLLALKPYALGLSAVLLLGWAWLPPYLAERKR